MAAPPRIAPALTSLCLSLVPPPPCLPRSLAGQLSEAMTGNSLPLPTSSGNAAALIESLAHQSRGMPPLPPGSSALSGGCGGAPSGPMPGSGLPGHELPTGLTPQVRCWRCLSTRERVRAWRGGASSHHRC